MKPADNRLCIAVRMALAVGVFAVAGGVAQAQDTGTNQASPTQTQNLKGVVVTGSLIRRVDIETASPVITIGRQHIDDSGSVTLGSVLQELPSIAGNAINPQVTGNGGGVANATTEGGSGASKLSLRGLGDGRTLVLINGQRLVNSDINLIPQEMVSQVDALAEGATTTYGSDAIGGVVNILTRDNFEGAQVSVSDGISGHGDAKRKSASLVVGHNGDKYRVEGGVGINKTGTAIGTDRDFSRTSYSLRNGVITPSSGSTFVPHMRIQLPANLRTQFGCPYVTLAQPDGSHLGDYKCFSNTESTYNEFPKYNYLQTDSLRRNGFFIGSYDFTPNITGFVNAFYVSTASTGLNAPDPTYTVDGWSVPASAPYNPFGVTFSSGVIPGDPNSGYEIRTRVAGNAPRVNAYKTETEQIITGLRGGFGDSSWLWNATLNYGHSERNQTNENENLVSGLQQVINTSNFLNQANVSGILQG
jgi:outer membrane receptor protein involved in Fe transport